MSNKAPIIVFMNMNPWLAEQMVPLRRAELERAAHPHSEPLALDELTDAPLLRRRPALSHHVGVLLIAVGRRLAEPKTLPAAFEGTHRR